MNPIEMKPTNRASIMQAVDSNYRELTLCDVHCCGLNFFNSLRSICKGSFVLIPGFFLGSMIRYILGTQSIEEPAIIHDSKGSILRLTDLLSCLTILFLCHILLQSEKSPKMICCNATLFTRVALRDSIPLVFGLTSMLVLKEMMHVIGDDYFWHGPNDSRLFELSDAIGGFILLITFHVLDRLLNRCGWRANPYEPIEDNISESRPNIQS